jgi:alpha-beta hydrolase superfamily lysophospholipase
VIDLLISCLTLMFWTAVWALFWRAFYHAETREDEVHFVTTSDGWRLAMARYRPKGERRSRFPVLLCHGLGSSRFGFDLAGAPSLAIYLAQAGFDVWSLELRGHGHSDRPSVFSPRHFGWCFDDYLHVDLPAAIAKLKENSHKEQLHMLGHSMGGMLLLCHSAENAPYVRSITTIGSSLDFSSSDSDFGRLLPFSPLAQALPAFPLGLLTLIVAPLTGRVQNRLEAFNLWFSNADPAVTRALYANTFYAVSSPVLLQLRSMFDQGGMKPRHGSVPYLDTASHTRIPTLFIAGDRDRQCPPQACRRTYEHLSQHYAGHQMLVFGPDTGQKDHYGHFDLLIGKRASEEVFPAIEQWLWKHDVA